MKQLLLTVLNAPFAIRTLIGIVLGYEQQIRSLKKHHNSYREYVEKNMQLARRSNDLLDKANTLHKDSAV